MIGDHRNFHVYGNCTRAKKPISARPTPSTRSQPGTSWNRTYSGRPEVKPVKTQISMRRLRIASLKVSRRVRSTWASAVIRPIVIHCQRRVIGESLVAIDIGTNDLVAKPGRHDMVVDAPADVLVPGAPAIGPPGVLLRLLVDRPERVDPSIASKDLVQP